MGCGASQAETAVNKTAITNKQSAPIIKEKQQTYDNDALESVRDVRPRSVVAPSPPLPPRIASSNNGNNFNNTTTNNNNVNNNNKNISQKRQSPQLEREQQAPPPRHFKSPILVVTNLNPKPVLKPIPLSRPIDNYNLSEYVGDDVDEDDFVDDEPIVDNTNKLPFDLENRSCASGSQDSGFSDNEYKNIITEKSNPELVQQIEKEFKERENLDLLITGRACPILLSAKERMELDKLEEMRSLQMLKDNGLVQQPLVRKENNSVRFEIIDEKVATEDQSFKQPDPFNKLAPLKRVPPQFLRSKEKSFHTQDQIVKKLEEAQKRKEEQTQQRINQLKILNAERTLDNYNNDDDDDDDDFRPHSSKRMDPEVFARQKKLLEIRDKIRAKNIEQVTPRMTPRTMTPRTQELINELDIFRPKTSNNFKPVFD